MENKSRNVKSLGRSAILGSFYDGFTDKIMNISLFKSKLPEKVINVFDTDNLYYEFTINNSYEEKFKNLKIEAELKLSILSGLFTLEGSGKYLSDEKSSYKSVKGSIIYELKTKKENFHLSSEDLKEYISYSSLEIKDATHIISGIQWGANVYCSFEYENREYEEKKKIEGRLQACLNKMSIQISGNANVNYSEEEKKLQNNLHIKFISDVVVANKELPQTYDKVLEYIREIPNHLKNINDGKGIQLEYELLPISFVETLFGLNLQVNNVIVSIEKRIIESIQTQMDSFLEAKQKFNDFKNEIFNNKMYFSSKELAILNAKDSEIKMKDSELKEALANKLVTIRSGKSNVSDLEDILKDFLESDSSSNAIDSFINDHFYMKTKVDDIITLKNYGIEHITRNTSPRNIVLQNNKKKIYILYYTTHLKTEKQDTDWKNNYEFFKKLKREKSSNTNRLFFLCDIELHSELKNINKKIVIHYYHNDKVVSEDFYEKEKEKLQLAYAKSDKIDVNLPKPNHTCLLSLKCPLWNNDEGCSDEELNWKCPKCFTNYEYGYDEIFYCNCGGAKYDTFLFKCSDSFHSDHFEPYPKDQLKKILDDLKKNRKDYNLLLLGETGVGKSTLINSLFYYLNFGSLDEAMQKDLKCIVPTKFQFMGQEITGGKEDPNENLKNDGGSATQYPNSHVFTFGGNKLLRIIDTPGIGDTRGLDKDRKNIDNILKYISNFDHLNGICIMLKPNNSRLNISLRYCMKELLTHLHKEARNNILFLYTNSRGTFYQPGDTDVPLTKLLKDIETESKILVPYHSNNTFCYDNEAFRYLCILKNIYKYTDDQKKQLLLSKNTYEISYEKSVETTIRMLKYIGSLKTHNVIETISLNEAKRLISNLAQPLAEITRNIINNENVLKDKIKEFENTKMTMKELENNLKVTREVLEAKTLGYPRTVCTNQSCVTYAKVQGTMSTIYSMHCHERCYLKGVTEKTTSNPALLSCVAMNGTKNCIKCGCLWDFHMHVTYEFVKENRQVEDEDTKKAIENAKNKKEVINILVNNLKKKINEYGNEKSIFLETSAEIANFIKLNSIYLFNDDFGNYLDLLIREEQGKLGIDPEKKNLKVYENMKKLRAEYEEKKKLFKEGMGNISNKVLTVDEIQIKINNLYKLTHFGKSLEDIMKVADHSHKNLIQFKENRFMVSQPKANSKGCIIS